MVLIWCGGSGALLIGMIQRCWQDGDGGMTVMVGVVRSILPTPSSSPPPQPFLLTSFFLFTPHLFFLTPSSSPPPPLFCSPRSWIPFQLLSVESAVSTPEKPSNPEMPSRPSPVPPLATSSSSPKGISSIFTLLSRTQLLSTFMVGTPY